MVIQYKCPSCGADMVYDPQSDKLQCQSCGKNTTIDELAGTKPTGENRTNTYEKSEEDIQLENSGFEYDYEDNTSNHSDPSSHTFGSQDVKEYHCNNCGATLMTDANTSATTCSFCGAGVVLEDRLSGSYAPSLVIPFKITKEQAGEAFKKWCKKGRLTPKGFMNADRIKNISGIYIPFWIYDMNTRGDAEATCTKVRTYTRGDYIYTETKYYQVYRKVDLNYRRIPCDASKRMDDKLMDLLEPYQYDLLKTFEMPYLAGYTAEKYDFDHKELLPRIQQRTHQYASEYIRSTIQGYSSTVINRMNLDDREKRADYALLPVWTVCYDYNGKEYVFAMNGETGKIVGKPPLSKSKIAGYFFGISGIVFLLFVLLTFLIGGGY